MTGNIRLNPQWSFFHSTGMRGTATSMRVSCANIYFELWPHFQLGRSQMLDILLTVRACVCVWIEPFQLVTGSYLFIMLSLTFLSERRDIVRRQSKLTRPLQFRFQVSAPVVEKFYCVLSRRKRNDRKT